MVGGVTWETRVCRIKRNEGRIPEPSKGDLHELLANANQQYPNHSLAEIPTFAQCRARRR